jgi:hypothetical protein
VREPHQGDTQAREQPKRELDEDDALVCAAHEVILRGGYVST